MSHSHSLVLSCRFVSSRRSLSHAHTRPSHQREAKAGTLRKRFEGEAKASLTWDPCLCLCCFLGLGNNITPVASAESLSFTLCNNKTNGDEVYSVYSVLCML